MIFLLFDLVHTDRTVRGFLQYIEEAVLAREVTTIDNAHLFNEQSIYTNWTFLSNVSSLILDETTAKCLRNLLGVWILNGGTVCLMKFVHQT